MESSQKVGTLHVFSTVNFDSSKSPKVISQVGLEFCASSDGSFSKSPKNMKPEILSSCEHSMFFFRRDFALNLSNKKTL